MSQAGWRTKLSQKLEAKLARDVGGKVQPASGAMFHSKGDVKGSVFLLEHKATLSKKSYTIKATELAAIETKAMRKGMIPALVFELVGLRTRYAIVPVHVVQQMEEEAKAREKEEMR